MNHTLMDTEQQRSDLVPSIPGDALIFRFPRVLAPLMFVGSIFFLALGVFVAAPRIAQPSGGSLVIALISIMFCGPMSILSLRSALRLRDRVAVNSNGIWYLRRNGESTFIGWHDVGDVKANDTAQRLVVTDSSGDKKIRLEYQLENFGKLREFVVSHTRSVDLAHAPGPSIFHRNWINKSILLAYAAAFSGVAWYGVRQRQGGPSVALITFAGLFLLAVALDPLRVEVGGEGIVIFYPGWKRTIRYDQITGISLKDVASRGNVWTAVIIARRDAKPIKLFRFREGSLALRDALLRAWQSAPTASDDRNKQAGGTFS